MVQAGGFTGRWMRGRGRLVALAAALTLAGGCDDDPSGPVDQEGIRFELTGDAQGSFAATDTMEVGEGELPEPGDWAIAADPDSVGGIALSAFRGTGTDEGDLFILQLSPVRTGTFDPCGPNEDCRGRIFVGLKTDFSSFDAWYEVVEGTATVDEITEDRVRGSFELVLRSDGGEGEGEITLEEGFFDVPFAGEEATAVIRCRIGGLSGQGAC